MGKGNGPPWVVPDDLWGRIEPLLPVRQRRPRHPGRLPLDGPELTGMTRQQLRELIDALTPALEVQRERVLR
ncbi:hypothetical protein ACWEN3_44130, partial [Streptomyces sp. NPDC004561]